MVGHNLHSSLPFELSSLSVSPSAANTREHVVYRAKLLRGNE